MVNDKRTSVHQIIASPLVKGIFDEWTWDGTGRFVFSVALTLGYGIYGQLKERYAINKVVITVEDLVLHFFPVLGQVEVQSIKLLLLV